jgi:hypothetical protein
MGDAPVLDLLAAVPAEQVHHGRVGAEVIPGAIEGEVAQYRGVVLDARDQPQPFAQVVEAALRIGRSARRQDLADDVVDLFEDRPRVDPAGLHELVQHPLVGIGVHRLLADEPAHILGQSLVLHQRECLVVGADEPALGRGQRYIEQAHHVRRHRVARNPVQWGI